MECTLYALSSKYEGRLEYTALKGSPGSETRLDTAEHLDASVHRRSWAQARREGYQRHKLKLHFIYNFNLVYKILLDETMQSANVQYGCWLRDCYRIIIALLLLFYFFFVVAAVVVIKQYNNNFNLSILVTLTTCLFSIIIIIIITICNTFIIALFIITIYLPLCYIIYILLYINIITLKKKKNF